MIRSKSRGHQRKFKRLLRWMDKIDPFKNANDWDRKGPYQIWTRVDDKRSFAKERGIMTKLPEIGYIEELNDEDYYTKSNIWFYGEWI